MNVSNVEYVLPAFEESATIFYTDISNLTNWPKAKETQAKKIGEVSHKVIFQ